MISMRNPKCKHCGAMMKEPELVNLAKAYPLVGSLRIDRSAVYSAFSK